MFPRILERFRSGASVPAVDYVAGWRRLEALRAIWAERVAGFDAVLVPTSPILPPDADRLMTDGAYYVGENLLALRNTRIANMMGLKNCFADVTGWSEISEEQVLERNPDYIMTISMYFGEGPTPEEEIASRAGWENVTAVKNGAILNLQNNELSRPAPRLAEGAQMLADFIAGVEANDKAA